MMNSYEQYTLDDHKNPRTSLADQGDILSLHATLSLLAYEYHQEWDQSPYHQGLSVANFQHLNHIPQQATPFPFDPLAVPAHSQDAQQCLVQSLCHSAYASDTY